jgi:hypothetical protein
MRTAVLSLRASRHLVSGTSRRSPRWLAIPLSALLGAAVLVPFATASLVAQSAPSVETPVPFDSAGRIPAISPTLVSRLALTAPAWPVSGAFREARLFRTETGSYVLVVQRTDGAVARFALSDDARTALQRAVSTGLLAQGTGGERLTNDASTGVVASQPAGNRFVRNQTLLGLAAYGPATAALLSNSGPAAAGGGYFLAAGTSFFVAANLVKNRPVTRAQSSLASHGGTRGAAAGAAIAAIANANDGPGWGAPILLGAIGGTMGGYWRARGLSDGEAASAGFVADLAALTALGIGGTADAFRRETREVAFDPERPDLTYTETDDNLRTPGKATLGAAIGASMLGYAFGPRYARRASYNVTAGDVSVAFASAALGALAATAIPGDNTDETTMFGVATAGMLTGAWLADRALVRTYDRTSADGTLVQLGALAGALMGGGVAAISEANRQGALALVTAGGTLGLVAADRILAPVRDAGPLRGIMETSARALDDRVRVSIGPVTSVRIAW